MRVSNLLLEVGKKFSLNCQTAFVKQLYAVDHTYRICDVFDELDEVDILGIKKVL